MGWIEVSGADHKIELIAVFTDYGITQTNKMDIENLPGDSRYKIDMDERLREFQINNAMVTNYKDYTGLMEVLDDDSNITLRVRRNAAGDYMVLHGTSTSMTVACVAYSKPTQMDYAGARWKINRITLKESG